MIEPLEKKKDSLPQGLILEKPPFVPRMVMTARLQTVMKEVLHQWRHRQAFAKLTKYGIRPLDRLLFYGPPGNGKTMACYWMARELDIPIYRVLCNQLHGPYVGETTQRTGAILDHLNALPQPAICLWDEIESIFVNRTDATGGGGREMSAALTVFLQSLDRWRAPVLLVMATNLLGKLDAALVSRVELSLEFCGPDADQCQQMLSYWVELLTDSGGDDWGPLLAKGIADKMPQSFRELQQRIGFAAREWTASKLRK